MEEMPGVLGRAESAARARDEGSACEANKKKSVGAEEQADN